ETLKQTGDAAMTDLVDMTIKLFAKLCMNGDGWSSAEERAHILEDYIGDSNYVLDIWDADAFTKVEGSVDALHVKRAQTFTSDVLARTTSAPNVERVEIRMREAWSKALAPFGYESVDAVLGMAE